jgi:pimeloyl-ACP methyl ester carboxylesterase
MNIALIASLLVVAAANDGAPINLNQNIGAPTNAFNVGMLRVEHSGLRGGTPIIFIPALFCGSWQWQREIAVLSAKYDVYAVTLPGFDGRPRDTGGNLMNRAVSDIAELIRTRKLDRPIIVGHSLGGTLAVLVGETHARDVRSIISVDGGYPVAPTQGEREQRVRASTAPYIGIPRAAFGDSLRKNMLQYVITGKADVDRMAQLAARSDPAAVVDWMRAALLLDLTPQLAKINVQFTTIVPFDSAIDSYQGHASIESKRVDYAAWVARAPHGSLVVIDHSRHFVMLDQPAEFDRALFAAIDEGARSRFEVPV